MNHLSSYRIIFAAFLTVGMLSACTVKRVSEYDASIKQETLEIAKKVDLFRGNYLIQNCLTGNTLHSRINLTK